MLTENVLQEVIVRTAEKAVAHAKQNVRKDLGDLANSIESRIGRFEATIGSDSDHAIQQEYGEPTRNNVDLPNTQPPTGEAGNYTFHPYMRPAAEFAGRQEEIDKSLEAAIKRFT